MIKLKQTLIIYNYFSDYGEFIRYHCILGKYVHLLDNREYFTINV